MQINWHVFRPPTITESHVAHAPTSHTSISEITHVLEWIISFKEMTVGLICEDQALGLHLVRFLAAHLYNSKLIYLSGTDTLANALLEDLTYEKRSKVDILCCSLSDPPLKVGCAQTLIVVGLHSDIPVDFAKALKISSEQFIVVVDHKQYLRRVSPLINSLDYRGVGYVGRDWILISLNKTNGS